MTESVLVPFDGSDQSESALDHALRKFPDGSVTALFVVDLGGINYGGVAPPEAVLSDLDERAGETVRDAVEIAAGHDREIDTETRRGQPAREIVGYADEGGFDHIVIGSHGRDGVSRILLGSVAELVVRRASVPVTVVR
ncbi:MAG: universal stress protein [Natronomonas sp.]